jgi:phage shock protein A
LSPRQVAFESQARHALGIGRGDLAQAASARTAEIGRQLSDLAAHCRWLRAEEERFTMACAQLAAKG